MRRVFHYRNNKCPYDYVGAFVVSALFYCELIDSLYDILCFGIRQNG